MGTSSLIGIDDAGARTRRRRHAALRVIEGVLLAAGATLLVVYAAAQVDARRGSQQALEAFAQARGAATAAYAGTTPVAGASLDYSNHPDQSLWGTARIAAYRASLGAHRDTPLGVLTIPAVDLEAPIFEGTSELTLNRGIGHIEGTADIASAGNLGLAAHRDGFFRVLKNVGVGDTVTVESLQGTSHYRVTELLVVEPTDVYVLAPTQAATLTLVTCYPFYFVGEAPQRYIVKAIAEEPSA
jgi:sortase A